MTPKKYPQNLHTPKRYSFFWKPPKILKFRILNPKKARAYVCVKISEYPPPPPAGPSLTKLFGSTHAKVQNYFFVALDKPRGFIFVCVMVNHIIYGPRRKKACLRGFANNRSSVWSASSLFDYWRHGIYTFFFLQQSSSPRQGCMLSLI